MGHVSLLGTMHVTCSGSKPLLPWNGVASFLRTFPHQRFCDFCKKHGVHHADLIICLFFSLESQL